MSTSATATRTSTGAIFLFACAILTGFFGVASLIFPDIPPAVGIAAAAVTGLSGIVSAYRTMRPRHAAPPPPTSTWPPPPTGWPPPSGPPHPSSGGAPVPATPSRVAGVRPFWLGATVVFGLLSLAFAPSALVMIFTGLMAFRRPKAAAGVAVALLLVSLACLGLLAIAYLFDYQAAVPSSPYELCLAQGYDPTTCAYYS